MLLFAYLYANFMQIVDMEKIKDNIISSLYLDLRKVKKNGKYPLKIRLFNSKTRKQKFFPTNFEFTKEEHTAILSNKTKSDKDWYLKLSSLLLKVNKAIDETKPFDFEVFENKLYDKYSKADSVKSIYTEKINELIKSESIGTADMYKNSLRSIELFLISRKSNLDNFNVSEINHNWLTAYRNYITKTRGNSSETAGMYLRNIRSIYNLAIQKRIVDAESYPFGKNGFQIKTQTKSKFTLLPKDIEVFKNLIPKNKSQELAKDYFLMSYYCCGINLTDIAYFSKTNFTGDTLTFFRKKTEETTVSNIEIRIPLRNEMLEIINKYRDDSKKYVFGIIDENDDATERKKKIKNFNNNINKDIKKLKQGKIDIDVTFYTARHSWATNMVIAGASTIYIQQQLGHTDLKTTMGYIATLPVSYSNSFIDKFFGKI